MKLNQGYPQYIFQEHYSKEVFVLCYALFLCKYNQSIDEYETLNWTVSPKIT